jgi:HAE1 family hydrophobic/amphiphilic exporter-1
MTAWQYRGKTGLTSFSLDRRITVLVLFLTTLVVGAVATLGIPLELIPRGWEGPFMRVYVPWQDAPPRAVLDNISLPLEEELSTVRGIDRIASASDLGGSRIYMWFKQGTDMAVAYREVRDRIERARRQFPDDVDQVYIRKDDDSGLPVYGFGVAIDPSVPDPYDLIQNEIVMPLERIDGVASVENFGLEEKEILIELDRERTAASGLNIYELAMRMSDDNFTLASGDVREGSHKLLLRSIARYDSLEEIENLNVGNSQRLRDIATIKYEEAEKEYRARAMSRQAVAIHAMMEGDANASEVSERVDAFFVKLQDNPRLSGMQLLKFFSQGDIIDESLSTLLESGAIGGVIAALTLFLFLRRFRLTMIIGLSIPLSMLMGLTVMYFTGETLNLLSLLGLMLCVGLLVDNSVVVAENIYRLHQNGMPRREACINGAGEIALAITMSTLTTIVVFLPIALVDGPAQFFLMRLAMPVTVSLLGSLVVALVFIPLCVYLTLPSNGKRREKGVLGRAHDTVNGLLRWVYEHTFGPLNRAYGRMLGYCLHRRLDLVIGVAVVFALTSAVTFENVEFVEMSEDAEGAFEFEAEFPQHYTLEESDAWVHQAETVFEDLKEELGLEGYFFYNERTFAFCQAWFPSPRVKDVTAREAKEAFFEALPETPGVTLYTGDDGEDDEDEEHLHVVTLHGEDPDVLDRIATDIQPLFLRVDGVMGLKKEADRTPNELGLVVDRERAQQYGVNPQVVAGVVGYALRGSALPKYIDHGKEIPVRIRFQEEDRDELAELGDFMVPTETGEMIPVSAVTDVKMLNTPERIIRRNKRVSHTITLELEKGSEEEARERIMVLASRLELPEGVSIGEPIRLVSNDEDFAALQFAGIMSIVFIYLLMGFLFESFILPLSIVLTIPLSIIGVFWIHFITGRDIDFLGAVGMILLVGVVVNNGIVLIDYVNRLRKQGKSRDEAIRLATDRRFRPIMMTAITTIGGMVPLALSGVNSIGWSYASFSMTLIGGMTTATLLTLLVVPVFYTFFDDLREQTIATLNRLKIKKGDVPLTPAKGTSP